MPATSQTRTVLERDFQATVVDAADTLGWLTYHTYDSRRSREGFPDLVLVRGRRVVYAELKRVGGKPSAAQVEWLDTLAAAGQEVYLWTMDDWHELVVLLTRGPSFRTALSTAGSAWIPRRGRRDATKVSQHVPEAA